MKKLTVLFAAVICAAMSFAACNEYGWTSVEDMYKGLAEDVWAYHNDVSKASGFTIKATFDSEKIAFSPSDLKAGTGIAFDVEPWDMNFFADEAMAAKWGWLVAYMDTACAHAGQGLASSGQAQMRYNLTAFFSDGYRDSWPKSADYATIGVSNFLAWQPSWGSSWCIKEVCNDYGWMSADDMYKALAEDVWAYHNDASKASGFTIKATFDSVKIAFSPSDLKAGTGIAFDVEPWDMNFFNDSAMAAKWGWLVAYMDTACAHAGQGLASSGQAQMRYNLTAFFSDGYRDSWPKSADYATIGVSNFLAWQPSWGQAFCTGGKIVVTYDLQGAVTNDYGWMNADDMYKGLAEDVWAYHNDASKASGFTIKATFDSEKIAFSPSDLKAGTGIAFDVEPWDMNFFNDSAMAAKWGWLVAYMDTACAHAGQGLASSGQAQMRYNLTAFFSDGYRDSWPKSADYATIGVGTPEAYMPTWKHAFDNPTEISADTTIALNTPYKEGETFRGWFFDAAGQGQEVKELTSLVNGLTLYAVFGAYQMSLAEVAAAEDNAEIYTSGVAVHVDGKNVYIQDATGGMLVYFNEAPAVTVGQRIVVSGVKATYGGAPEIKNAELKEAAASELPAVQVKMLSELLAEPLKFFGQRVQVNDVRIAKYDNKGNPFVVSGLDTVQCYKMVIDQTAFPVGQRVNLTAVAAYYNAFQFVGDIAGFEKIIYQGLKDPNTYDNLVITAEEGDAEGVAAGEQFTYTIENNWLISDNLGNWAKNKPNPVSEQCRGMAVKDGIIYITYRPDNTCARGSMKLVRYDAETGEKLADLPLKDYVFCQPAEDTTGTRCVKDEATGISYLAEGYEWNYDEFTSDPIFAPNTDMHVDYDGNILVASLPTEGHVYQIWKLTEDENGVLDGGGELVLYVGGNSGITDFAQRYPDDPAIRLDRFDLAGSVDGDAWIFAPSQNSSIVYEMDIVNGKWDGECWNHVCQNGDVAFSYSPRIAVVDGGEAFYVDGFSTYPALFANDGTMLEDFAGIVDDEGEEVNPSAMILLQNEDGVVPTTNVNGVHEFSVGGAYFFAMGAGGYDGAYQPYGSTLILRFQNENRHFYEMQRAWEVSKDGFGNNKDPQRNHMQCSVQKDDLTTELYVYYAENGIGKYTITADKYFGEQETGLEAVKASVKAGDVKKVMVNGRMFIIRDGKAFSAMGQKF